MINLNMQVDIQGSTEYPLLCINLYLLKRIKNDTQIKLEIIEDNILYGIRIAHDLLTLQGAGGAKKSQ